MNKFRIAVFGDFMQDVYYCGEATRVSPEAPIPVVKIEKVFTRPGGAGNVAESLRRLGCRVFEFDGNEETSPTKSRLMIGDHQIARWDMDDICSPIRYPFTSDGWDAVVVADYGKGGITELVVKEISRLKCPIFVDTKRDPSVWSGVATAVFPNEKEYDLYTDQYDEFDGIVVYKKGVRGLSLLGWPEGYKEVTAFMFDSPSQARFVRSVNGAGDTVMAAFVYAFLTTIDNSNINWQEILNFANAAAAIAVENPYTYAPTLKEVNERYYATK